ncbi:MAG TPA: CPBP family intramembrane glutamic endopeptidase [Tepidisphaeraceae bacterium]|jgi:membrane protease YdiL (CAAX protease family)
MSICLAQDTLTLPWQIGIGVVGLAVAAAIAAFAGVFRARSVTGPQRLRPEQPLWPILVSALVGVGFWLGTQTIYAAGLVRQLRRAHPGQPIDLLKWLSPGDFAFLATVPGVAGFFALLLANQKLDARLSGSIAPWPRKLSGAIGKGAVGTLIVFPLMLAASALLEMLYKQVGYQHPTSHELLAAMKGLTNPLTKSLLIFGACIVAPVFEEYLFRGHLQTFLARIFDPAPARHTTPPPLPGEPPVDDQSDATLSAAPARSALRAWLAILVTSILFAGVHPAWTAPLIFLLSLCLGYAYERTGNIWVPILIHASFNTFNTLFYLKTMAGLTVLPALLESAHAFAR